MNIISVILKGIDQVTPVAKQVAGDIKQGFAFAGGMALFDKAMEIVPKLTSGLREAITLQTRYISSSGAMAAVAKISFQDATKFTEDLRIALGDIAATLPGTTQDYLSFANGINAIMVKGYNVQTPKGLETYKKDLIDISKRYELMGMSEGVQTEDSAYAIKQFLTQGYSLDSLKPLSFAQRVPHFLDEAKAELKLMGKSEKEFTKFTTEQRASILKKLGNRIVSNEMISALQGTADSVLEAWKDSLFNQDRGVFGFMRKIKLRGDRSAIDYFTELLTRLNSLGIEAHKLASRMGISFDPMIAIVDVITWLSNFVSTMEGAIVTAKSPGTVLTNVIHELGVYLTGMFKGVNDWIANVDIWSWVSDLTSNLFKLFTSIDWTYLGEFLGIVLGKLVVGLGALAVQLLDPRKWAAILWVIAELIAGFLIGLYKAFKDPLRKVFVLLVKAVNWLVEAQLDMVVKPIKSFSTWLIGLWDSAKSGFVTVGRVITGFIDSVKSVFARVSGLAPAPSVASNILATAVQNTVPGASLVKGAIDLVKAVTQPKTQLSGTGAATAPVNPVKPLEAPKTGTVKQVSFAPNVTIHGTDKPETTAELVGQTLANLYNEAKLQYLG